ncbi:uncharacterized protein HMPREF1541_07979 [Cyphellophora europaea CBS 101466]|uniref:Endonuclease/exonuclease/phosphatase domain-containing protein n=1 Tax=Cyphellophora europaea (strain CBS 101466) TaxID=1220924 RepID=W2RKJ5_CYPE1|nr:uncharacterized protein HMPREF1541_07979 [Cyphellophora europaea CBS 101466]ETN36991.1 hypothetical protein HMPREF1541_07979 [Cyphellophora europaea CBS 101466]
MVNFSEIIQIIESKRKPSLPWEREEPVPQPFYSYSPTTQTWQAVQPTSTETTSTTQTTSSNTTFSILSWNIDFMLPSPTPRMAAALSHLHSLLTNIPHPAIVFLNEMLESDLTLLQATPWVRERYHLTDLDAQHWESGYYGTCMLIPRTLPVTKVFRVHYSATGMERDALFVDVAVLGGAAAKLVRLCTTHLESLVAEPPKRPRQVASAARFLVGEEARGEQGLVGGVMGGDFNAIQPFDRTLHVENGLRDAYLEMGGEEDSEEGYTWGQMAPTKQREMFGCSRMDKLFVGGEVEVVGFERFGLGVKVGDEEVERVLREEEGMEEGWVTDHAGVWGTFKLKEGEKGVAKI